MSTAQENVFGPRRSTMKTFGCCSRAGSVFRRCDGFVALRLRCELVFICRLYIASIAWVLGSSCRRLCISCHSIRGDVRAGQKMQGK